MFTLKCLLIYLSDINNLVRENNSWVSWYTVGGVMLYIAVLPHWLSRETILREGKDEMKWRIDIIGCLLWRNHSLRDSALACMISLWITGLRGSLLFIIGPLALDHLVMILADLWLIWLDWVLAPFMVYFLVFYLFILVGMVLGASVGSLLSISIGMVLGELLWSPIGISLGILLGASNEGLVGTLILLLLGAWVIPFLVSSRGNFLGNLIR